MTTEPDWLLCRVGERVLAVPLAAVAETMRPLPIATIPGVPAFVLGVSTIRGVVQPVIDVAVLLGVDHQPTVTRFVTLSIGPRSAALAVGSVLGIHHLDADHLRELPALLHSIDRPMLSAIGTLDADLLLALDHSRLVPDSVWAALTEAALTEAALTEAAQNEQVAAS